MIAFYSAFGGVVAPFGEAGNVQLLEVDNSPSWVTVTPGKDGAGTAALQSVLFRRADFALNTQLVGHGYMFLAFEFAHILIFFVALVFLFAWWGRRGLAHALLVLSGGRRPPVRLGKRL